MKTKFALIAIIAGAAMMSCQKEAEFGPSYLTTDSRELRDAGNRNPLSVITNRVEQRFSYNAQGELEQVSNGGRTQKRFTYDGEGRLIVLALPESNEEIRFRYELGALPIDAIRVAGTEEVADITYTFDEFGKKIAEFETERSTGIVTEYAFEYDGQDRLISTMKKVGDELISLVRPDVFIDGSSHLANLSVLSLVPGESLQIGLPAFIMVDDQSGHNEIALTYALNAAGQPDKFTSSTNGRRAVKSAVTY